jgi:hypothetical protein
MTLSAFKTSDRIALHARVVRPSPEYLKGLGTQKPGRIKVRISGQASLGSMPRGYGTKNWSHMWKTHDLIN